MISMRLQSRSPPMVIHTKNDQDPSQPVQHCSLFFIRILLASFSKNSRTNILLPLIPPLGPYQETFLQKSYNLRFDFVLQHMKKSHPRTSTPHLPIFSPLFFLIFSLNFLIFLLWFFLTFSSLITCLRTNFFKILTYVKHPI